MVRLELVDVGRRRVRATAARGLSAIRCARGARRAALSLVGFGVATLALRQLGGAGQLAGAADRLSRPVLGWVAVALAAEVVSYLFYAAAQRQLLHGCVHAPSLRWLASLAICAQSLSNFLPGGYIAANLLNFRALTRRGLTQARSARLLLASSGLYIGVLACLTLTAAELAGAGAGSWVRILAAASLGSIVVLFALARCLLRRRIVRLPSRWTEPHPPLPGLRAPTVTFAGLLFLGSWLADAGCLLAAGAAVHVDLARTAMPIAYCGAQLVSFMPITPGGLGLVEGSLALTLVGHGTAPGPILAAVLVYRIISYWGTLPAGSAAYFAIRQGRSLDFVDQRDGFAFTMNADPSRSTRSTSLSHDGEAGDFASPDRALGADRPLLVLER